MLFLVVDLGVHDGTFANSTAACHSAGGFITTTNCYGGDSITDNDGAELLAVTWVPTNN
jgi:hypothetical protein